MAQDLSDKKKPAPPRAPHTNGTDMPGVQRPRLVPQRRGFPWRTLVWILVLLLVAAALVYHFHFQAQAKPAADASAGGNASGGARGGHHGGASDKIRVVTGVATKGNIGVYLTGLGAVTPLNTDTIKTRVNGQLMKVLFKEGQMVQAGDLLLQIDSRPYEVTLAQNVAQKEHDAALLENANIDLQRYQTLWAQNSIPQQTLATQESLVKQDQGTVDIDQSAIDATKLNIIYCNITAPVSGRVGLRLVDPGNYVQSTDTTGLVVITQIQPITVIFTIPEDSIEPVLSKYNAGQTLPVDAYNRDMKTKLASGELLTLDNEIDPTTGTVKLKAIFANEDNALFPNQFVNARLLVETKKDVTLVPVPAIQHGNNGTFIYVVDTTANTVKITPVEVGTIDGNNAEIVSGVNPGDTVVTDGVDKLQDGSKVIVQKPGAGGSRGTTPDSTAGPAPANT
jgi:multidrug efflux system membrane fusion protein